MAAAVRKPTTTAPMFPVLLGPLLDAVAPVAGRWVDGTLGAGGYARGLLEAGAGLVIGIDRDPVALSMAEDWGADYGERFRAVEGNFADLDVLAGQPVDGVTLDLGVSSMQLDDRARGFSFMGEGPLDMRMGASGPTAADLVNTSVRTGACGRALLLWRGARLAADRARHRSPRAPRRPSRRPPGFLRS